MDQNFIVARFAEFRISRRHSSKIDAGSLHWQIRKDFPTFDVRFCVYYAWMVKTYDIQTSSFAFKAKPRLAFESFCFSIW